MKWMFSKSSYEELLRQRHYFAQGEDRPVRWEGYLADLIESTTGNPVSPFGLKGVLDGRSRMLAWNPNWETLTCAIARRLTFIAWGTRSRMPPRHALKRIFRQAAMQRILRDARPVLVNERVTANEVARLAGREAVVIPHFVDTEFWSYRDCTQRQSFLFCPSTVDRDGDKLLELARTGHEITWLANDHAICAKYSGADRNLTLIKEVPYGQVRELYQTCRAVILPLRRDEHVAGQTTAMEAIACGAPVYLSAGRTATIFEGVPSVRAMADDAWQTVPISAMPNDITAVSARWLRETHMPRLQRVLDRILTTPDDMLAIQAAIGTPY